MCSRKIQLTLIAHSPDNGVGERQRMHNIVGSSLLEAMHLLARFSRAHDALFGLLENGALTIAFRIDEQYLRPAQAASKISGQADVARRCVYRADGRNLWASRRTDARFRFLTAP